MQLGASIAQPTADYETATAMVEESAASICDADKEPKHVQPAAARMGYYLDQPLVNVSLPSILHLLTFGQSFDQSLDNMCLSSSLQQLGFG